MTDDSKGADGDLATLGAAIARMERQLQPVSQLGGDVNHLLEALSTNEWQGYERP